MEHTDIDLISSFLQDLASAYLLERLVICHDKIQDDDDI